jgi:predicted enzyme related to lactoylglutathione lyase
VEIGYVTFGSPDTRVAAEFYGALFGWATEPGASGEEYAHIDNTKLPMGLAPGSVEEAPVIYFRVDDIARYVARVRELGGEVVSETTYDSGPNAVCTDSQGRQFQLWQPAPGY